MHVRKQIRDAVVTRLTGLLETGDNVFRSRSRRVPEGQLPALIVYTTDERSQVSTEDPDDGAVLERRVTIEVEMLAHEAEADDRLDSIAVEVEIAMADETLGGLVRDLVLSGTRDIYSSQGERIAGGKRLLFEAIYLTAAGDPETAL